jgi:putative restriction endonuclease
MPEVVAKLSPALLEQWVLNSLEMSGRTVLRLSPHRAKPMRVVLGGLGNEESTVLRIYARNITHGGGAARAADEYRIQLTGEMPETVAGETTIVLGWSTTFHAFAGWDPAVHVQRSSSSPSLQIREETLVTARETGLAAAARHSADVVVAFRAEMLATYCLNAQSIHDDIPGDIAKILNAIPTSTGVANSSTVTEILSEPRRKVARIVESNYRAWDFADRVKTAYSHRCAVCSVQLALTEAAHIVPVAWPGSNDLTSNGLSLCRNHHRAYDANLLSVTPSYVIEVSATRGNSLTSESLNIGLDELMQFHGTHLAVIPVELPDQPNPLYLKMGREARRWVG